MWLILSGDWKVVKMGRFWPKSKAIHLVFWPIFIKIQCDWFWVEIEKWWKWADFDQKVRLYLGILTNFGQNSMWLILSGDWKVVKMGRFWPKSKAIHLVFWPIFIKIQCDWFWVEIEKWWKWADFDQKVRLYTWYFDQFSSKFNVTDFEWRLKSGENGQILPKSKAIHLVFSLLFGQNLPIFTTFQSPLKISLYIEFCENEKWWKWADFDQKVSYTLVFWPRSKFNVLILSFGQNQILTKK